MKVIWRVSFQRIFRELMIKVLHKRLRKINSSPGRGSTRQGLQLVRHKETKTALPKLKRGLWGTTALWERCKMQRASHSLCSILRSLALLWLQGPSVSGWIHYTPRDVDNEILFRRVNEHVLPAEPRTRGRGMY